MKTRPATAGFVFMKEITMGHQSGSPLDSLIAGLVPALVVLAMVLAWLAFDIRETLQAAISCPAQCIPAPQAN
jgi:hypothetical protein